MGFFTALVEAVYPDRPFTPFPARPGLAMDVALALAWASQLAYEAADRDKLSRILARWSWQLAEPLHAEAAVIPSLGRVGGYAATFGDDTIVAFAGTEPERVTDWLRIAAVLPNRAGVHSGFAAAVAAVWPTLETIVQAARRDIYLTGHSLGGAIAAAAAHRLCTELPGPAKVRAVYGFGMPRVGTDAFATRYDDVPAAFGATLGAQSFRLVHGDDMIPTLPPRRLGYHHVGRLLHAPHGGRFDPATLAAMCLDPSGSIDLSALVHLLRGLGPDRDPALPPYPAEHPAAGLLVDALPRLLRDHVMDRVILALQP